MAELTVDLTYGNALYSAAKELDKREEFLQEGEELAELLSNEPELLEFMKEPVISASQKKEALNSIFRGRILDEMLNFLCILVDKGRISHFVGIIKEYGKLMNEDAGVSYGSIVSISRLSQEELNKFENEASKLFKKNVKLKNEIDKTIIGGVKILADGRIIDASIRRQIDDMADTLYL